MNTAKSPCQFSFKVIDITDHLTVVYGAFKLTGCFLIPYLICLVVAGVPVLILEIGVGQYTSQGGITAWKICPLFQGKKF